MPTLWCINRKDWAEHYEQLVRARQLKAGPLEWVKLQVYGHRSSPAYRRLIEKAQGRHGPWAPAATMGVWCKLLELAADEPRPLRPYILDEDDRPADAAYLAWLLMIPPEVVAAALEVLVDVRWIEQVEVETWPPSHHPAAAPGDDEPARLTNRTGFSGQFARRVVEALGLVGEKAADNMAPFVALGQRVFDGEFGRPQAAMLKMLGVAERVAQKHTRGNVAAIFTAEVHRLKKGQT